jgi:hypothetical protein
LQASEARSREVEERKREAMERKGEVVERVDEATLSLNYQKKYATKEGSTCLQITHF